MSKCKVNKGHLFRAIDELKLKRKQVKAMNRELEIFNGMMSLGLRPEKNYDACSIADYLEVLEESIED